MHARSYGEEHLLDPSLDGMRPAAERRMEGRRTGARVDRPWAGMRRRRCRAFRWMETPGASRGTVVTSVSWTDSRRRGSDDVGRNAERCAITRRPGPTGERTIPSQCVAGRRRSSGPVGPSDFLSGHGASLDGTAAGAGDEPRRPPALTTVGTTNRCSDNHYVELMGGVTLSVIAGIRTGENEYRSALACLDAMGKGLRI